MCSNKETLESPAPATRFAFFYPSIYCFYFSMIVVFASCLLLVSCLSLFLKHCGQ